MDKIGQMNKVHIGYILRCGIGTGLILLNISCSTLMQISLLPFRIGLPFPTKSTDLYNAIWSSNSEDDVKWVEELLAKGADPNKCRGEVGWIEVNPLDVLMESFYNTYYRNKTEGDPPDIAIFKLLVEAGADIDKRPYIWHRVYLYNQKYLKDIKNSLGRSPEYSTPEAKQKEMETFVLDANRLLEAFLEAGADPDKPGHPYPYSYEAYLAGMNEKKANWYFSQGTRAINVAIAKGIMWESQVDLLLHYTKLDEESLLAAERSNDPVMVEKIKRLWEEQQPKE
jgi:hypothetical protein